MSSRLDRLKNIAEKVERKAKQSEFELAFVLEDAIEILKDVDPIKRRTWIKDQLCELYYQQNGKCSICGRDILWGQFHVDHKIPFSKGGGNEFSNLQLTHPFCNLSKSNGVSLSDLLRYLEGRVLNL